MPLALGRLLRVAAAASVAGRRALASSGSRRGCRTVPAPLDHCSVVRRSAAPSPAKIPAALPRCFSNSSTTSSSPASSPSSSRTPSRRARVLLLATALGGAAAGTYALQAHGGPLLNTLVERLVLGLEPSSSDPAWPRRQQPQALRGLEFGQGLPSELVVELRSIARRLGADPARLRVVVSSNAPTPAATGSQLFQGAQAYLVVPESYVLNYAVGRPPPEVGFLGLEKGGADAVDVAPNASGWTMPPSQRYELAHELAHVQLEHFLLHQLVQASAVALVLGAAPLLYLLGRVPAKAASLVSMWLIPPAFFGLKALSRAQEDEADACAAQAGYALGGLEFWARQVRFLRGSDLSEGSRARRPPAPRWWRSHPPAEDRLAHFQRLVRELEPHS